MALEDVGGCWSWPPKRKSVAKEQLPKRVKRRQICQILMCIMLMAFKLTKPMGLYTNPVSFEITQNNVIAFFPLVVFSAGEFPGGKK